MKTPPSLPSIQDLGAASRFKCFFGPRGILICSYRSGNLTLYVSFNRHKLHCKELDIYYRLKRSELRIDSPILGWKVLIAGEIFKLLCVLQLSMWAKLLSVVPDEDLQPGSYDDN